MKCSVYPPVVIAALLLTSPAEGALRCEYGLVNTGLTQYEVAERCGPADAEYQFLDFLLPDLPVHVDEWIYDFGQHKFRRLLRFENGRLIDIETRRKPRQGRFR